jgi:hypothetical protein
VAKPRAAARIEIDMNLPHGLPAPRWLLVALTLAVAVLGALAPRAGAQERKPRDLTHFNLGKSKLALSGYDPVAYFPEGGGKPAKGSESITATHEGVLYRFASEANKTAFLASPAKFEPQYGGWCAYAMAAKDKVEIDPASFLVRDGKLFLFYKSLFNDTRAKWLKDPLALQTKADKVWAELHQPRPKEG